MSWSIFIAAIKRKLYPIAYMQKSIVDWNNFRQLKGKTMKDYTHGFRRRALILGINLYSQENLLKYIGGLHSYLRHTILMFNPTNLDEVCVQATYLEARGNMVQMRKVIVSLSIKVKERVSLMDKERKTVLLK